VRRIFGSFYGRLSTIFLLLILLLGAGCIAIAFRSAAHLFDDVEQLLNRDTARSIAAELAPQVADGWSADRVAGAIHYMMVLNPMVEIYLLDDTGKILAYFLNPAERIERSSVDLAPVRAYVASGGRRLMVGPDPRSGARARPFSAAPLPMGGTSGYVYVILGGERYDASLRMIRDSYYLRAGFIAFLLALLATLIVGLSLFFFLTRRLSSLAEAVRAFERGELGRRVPADGIDELGALGRSFNEMASTIELAAVQGYLETMALKDGELSAEERQRFLAISLRNMGSLKRLVEQLFELARLDARQVVVRPERLQIAELAQDVALKLAPRAEDTGVSISVHPRGDLPLVSCDVGLIERVLTNLVENAVRFTPAGGSVRLELDPGERGVKVTVADTGRGIDADDLPHVFDRFYRADGSSGAGLGLAIARQIVDLHGGTLTVESAPGEGARFSFSLAVETGASVTLP